MEATLNCNEVRSAVHLFVGGDLDAPEARIIERHLASCGACHSEFERASAARSALRGLDDGTSPVPEVWTGLRRRMVEEGLLPAGRPAAARPHSGSGSAVVPRRRSLSRGLLAAAAALLFCIAGLLADDWWADGFDPAPATPVSGISPPDLSDEGSISQATAPEERGVPGLSLVQPVALEPLPFEEWPLGEALDSEWQSAPAGPLVPRPGAVPASLPPGIY